MSSFKMDLSNDVLFIIDRLNSCGYSAYVVGGSVRDSLIGRELGDFDITTSARPEETKAAFSDFKTVDTGIKHGTVTLVLGGTPYEITTYRVDGDYKDSRHPDSVTFTNRLEDDLSRRDFTVNAMAYDGKGGLVDPFGGAIDAQRKTIRAVGDPYLRFGEDALRILRALRFASVLGFDIEKTTADALIELSPSLKSISKERIYAEFKKLIMGVDAVKILTEYRSVFELILSGLRIERMPDAQRFDSSDIYTRLSSLFLLNSSDPSDTAERVLRELKTDKFTRTHTISVLSAYLDASFCSIRDTLVTLAKYGKETVDGVLSLGILVDRFGACEEEILKASLECGTPFTVSGLAVRGGDLIAAGITGERVGETLNRLLYAVIDGNTDNTKAALISYLAEAR